MNTEHYKREVRPTLIYGSDVPFLREVESYPRLEKILLEITKIFTCYVKNSSRLDDSFQKTYKELQESLRMYKDNAKSGFSPEFLDAKLNSFYNTAKEFMEDLKAELGLSEE